MGYATGCVWHHGDGGVIGGAVSDEVRGDGRDSWIDPSLPGGVESSSELDSV